MEGAQASTSRAAGALQPPYAVSSTPTSYGPIQGNTPDWASSNFTHKGKAPVPAAPTSLLATGGFEAWTRYDGKIRSSNRRHYHDSHLTQPSPSYAEPVAVSNQTSYFNRRTLRPAAASLTAGLGANSSCQHTADGGHQQFCGGAGSTAHAGGRGAEGSDITGAWAQDAAAGATYRPSKRMMGLPVHTDRPEGRKKVPEPQGGGGKLQGVKPFPLETRFPVSPLAPMPAMPRMGRPPGPIPGLRESDQEMSFEEQTGRRGKVAPEQLHGAGRAGDMTGRCGVEARVQDDPQYYRSFKDPPEFARFCKTLPKPPAVSCRERHVAGLAATQAAHMSAVMKEVQQLSCKDLPE